MMAISFSNKSSRYLCSGGSGQVVRIWDLQRKCCIKWLRGHTNTITGAMCNCKDMHLASVSLSGDVILHSLASGARAAEFKDPKNQVLRVLDYSQISRHLLVTAGDDGSVHLWDTTGRSPKGERSKMSNQSICFPHKRMSALLHAQVQIVWLNLVGEESETVELQAVGGELHLVLVPHHVTQLSLLGPYGPRMIYVSAATIYSTLQRTLALLTWLKVVYPPC